MGSRQTCRGCVVDSLDKQAIFDLTDAVEDIASALRRLGNADAATSFGAIEAHGMQVEKAGRAIADAITELAEAIREHR